MTDFCAHKHPVQAVACPDCKADVGSYCRRPSGHRASDFHKSRKEEADRVFIKAYGEAATIERNEAGEWTVFLPGTSEPRDRARDLTHIEARAMQSKMRTTTPQHEPGPLFDTQQSLF